MGIRIDRLHSTSLVILCGSLLALLATLAKLGAAAGVSAPQMAFITSAGAGLLLLVVNLRRGSPPPFDRHHIIAYAALGAMSFAFPNVLGFVVAAKLGAGFASALSALTPLFTLAGAAAIGQERLRVTTVTGLLLGSTGALLLLGAAIKAVPREVIWLLIALLVPAAHALGNVLRGLVLLGRPGTSTISGVLLTAALLLAPGVVLTFQYRGWSLTAVSVLAAAVVVATMFQVSLFRLQSTAGPVVLSQIGNVAAVVGVGVMAPLIGEQPPAILWLSIGLIALGMRLIAPMRAAPPVLRRNQSAASSEELAGRGRRVADTSFHA
jgi:drug/metabolite transporter (DMT)-like permease